MKKTCLGSREWRAGCRKHLSVRVAAQVDEAQSGAAIEHAAQMADRWNRIYLRTLRNLRDLRHYSPVTINNPQQVNIAADGGQQLNVTKNG